MSRKEIKAEAKKVVKKHYLLSVAICLMAILFSSVFINQMENNLVVDKINEVMGEDTVGMNRFSISDESYWTVLEDIHENDLDKAQNAYEVTATVQEVDVLDTSTTATALSLSGVAKSSVALSTVKSLGACAAGSAPANVMSFVGKLVK